MAKQLTLLDKRWMSLREAAHYSGIGKDRLKQLADEGAIRGAPDPDKSRGDWFFDRLSIDKYKTDRLTSEIRLKAMEIIRSVQTAP